MAYNGGVIVKPLDPVWRGRLKIAAREIDIDLAAYLNSTSSTIVGKVAEKMPETLELEMFAWRDVWPMWFDRVPPTEFSIHVLFLSEGRDEDRIDSMVNDVMSNEFALKGKMGDAELLIFTSYFLPERIQRYQGKFYLWGVFMGQFADFCDKLDSDAGEMLSLSLKSGNITPKCTDGPMQTPEENGALKKHPGMGKKRGRQLDDGWNHAKPLDDLRQRSECKYCGFLSEHGGISRLKAHLAGGGPRLQGCSEVPTEVKIAMTEWYSEWVKDTKAPWVKEPRRMSSPVNPSKRRAEDDVCEHVMKLDTRGYQTKCMYCGFVNRGGIKDMQLHLAGGNPAKNLEGCPDAPPDVKTLMSEGISQKTKETKTEIVEMELQEDEKTSETQWTYDQRNILQKTFEEVKHTTLKASLQKLIDKRNRLNAENVI